MENANENFQGDGSVSPPASPEEIQAAGESFVDLLLVPISIGGSALAEKFGGVDATRILIGAVTTVLAELVVRSVKQEHSGAAMDKITEQLRKTIEGGYRRMAELDSLDADDRKLLTGPTAGNA